MRKNKSHIVLIMIVLFSCNTDRNEVNGLLSNYKNSDLDSRLVIWLQDLKTNDFEVCKRNNCISESKQVAIFEYEKQRQTDSLDVRVYQDKFSDFYTANLDLWNPSEVIIQGESHPGRLIDFIIMNSNFISIGYTHGGFVTTPFFTTYQFEDEKVKNHWTIYRDDDPNNSKSEIASLVKQLSNNKLEILK